MRLRGRWVGASALDRNWAEGAKIHYADQSLWLLKPTTYMNASGASVAAALRYWKIEPDEMLVVHDDLDLRRARWRGSTSDAVAWVMKRLRDVFALGTGALRRCIGSRTCGQRQQGSRDAVGARTAFGGR